MSKLLPNELGPGVYTIEDLQKPVYPLGDHEGTIKNEYDDFTMKTKLILTHFGATFGKLRFDELSFFHILLTFEPYWDYKPSNAFNSIAPGTYVYDEFLNLNTTNKTHLKCDVIDGSFQDGVRQPILFSFALAKPTGCKAFCEPETIHYEKLNKSVLNTVSFF